MTILLAGVRPSALQAPSLIDGHWEAVITAEPEGLRRLLDLKADGTSVTGTLTTGFFAGTNLHVLQTAKVTGSFANGSLEAQTDQDYFLGRLKEGVLSGTYVYSPKGVGIYKTGWTAKR